MSDQTPPTPPTGPTPPTYPAPPPAYPAPPAPTPAPGGSYPPPPTGYQAYPPAYGGGTPEPSKTMAIVAFVLSFIPICLTQIAAIVMGFIVLSKAKKNEAGGRGLAIAAIVISFIVVAGGIALIAVGVNEDQKQDKARKSGSGDLSLSRLKVGDCLPELPTGTASRTFKIIPCSKPHLGEIYASFNVDEADDASQDEIDAAVEKQCFDRFEAFVGVALPQSKLLPGYVRPLKGLAFKLDKRSVCFVADASGNKTTGTLKGSKR